MKQIWLSADSHFGHTNIIRYSNRPFKDINEMDGVLINNINNCVDANDTLFHLGDFAFRGKGLKDYRDRIACRDIKLIVGNHDPRDRNGQPKKELREYFSEIYTMFNLHVNAQLIVLSHYAMRIWDKCHYGSMHAYAHSHNNLPDDPHARSGDVGVDAVAAKLYGAPKDYRPISVDEFIALMNKKQFKPIDHHGR